MPDDRYLIDDPRRYAATFQSHRPLRRDGVELVRKLQKLEEVPGVFQPKGHRDPRLGEQPPEAPPDP